jgi:hypothetical protein
MNRHETHTPTGPSHSDQSAQLLSSKCSLHARQELGDMAYAAKGQDALAVQAAKLEQNNYADFLFSKDFQPLGP